MYIKFWWRPLSALFHWVWRERIASSFCWPDSKHHLFLRCNFSSHNLLSDQLHSHRSKYMKLWSWTSHGPRLCKRSKTNDPFVQIGQKRMNSDFRMTAMSRLPSLDLWQWMTHKGWMESQTTGNFLAVPVNGDKQRPYHSRCIQSRPSSTCQAAVQ